MSSVEAVLQPAVQPLANEASGKVIATVGAVPSDRTDCEALVKALPAWSVIVTVYVLVPEPSDELAVSVGDVQPWLMPPAEHEETQAVITAAVWPDVNVLALVVTFQTPLVASATSA